MRADDVYFKPGDKVMRVGCGDGSGESWPGPMPATPQYGVVYCIEDFWEGPKFNVVMLVGFGGWRYDLFHRPVGWQARAFRKVDEIRLCIAAAAHAKKPDKTVA